MDYPVVITRQGYDWHLAHHVVQVPVGERTKSALSFADIRRDVGQSGISRTACTQTETCFLRRNHYGP